MICQRGDLPGSRNGGPIPPFPQEKLSEDAALAGSDSDNGRVGLIQTSQLSRSISAEFPPVRSVCECRIRVLFPGKAG